MKQKRSSWLAGILGIAVLTAIMGWTNPPCQAAEQKYPVRPIQAVVGYSPGQTDIYLRPFLERMSKHLGQPISFLYKPGAGGAMGATFVATSKPDGYTLFGCSTGPVNVGPITKELEYSLDSFTPISQFILVPMGIEVKADSPYKTLKDLVTAAKASPGKLTYSTSGVFGSDHFSMEMFQKVAGIKMTHVPCTGSAAANIALLGGHVDMTNCGIGIMKPHLDSGAVRLLGVMQPQRTKLYPDVPTFTEAGYPVVFPLWYGLLAPKDVPKDVLDIIRGAAKKTVDEGKAFFEENLASQGVELNYLGYEEFDKSNRAISKIIKEIFQELKTK